MAIPTNTATPADTPAVAPVLSAAEPSNASDAVGVADGVWETEADVVGADVCRQVLGTKIQCRIGD